VIADLKPYEENKASGLSWLEQVPSHWEMRRSKYLFREMDQRSVAGAETRLSMSQRHGLIPSSQIEERRLVSESNVGGKLCEPGDLVLNRLKAHLGVLALSPTHGLVSPDYTVLRPIGTANHRYFCAVYRSPYCGQELRQRAKGIVEGFWRLYTDDFYDIRVPLPPPAEQAAIVRFLDWVNGRLERAIRAKRKVIALLNEQKQAIIHRAVTRGLDPSVPLKPSGIPWLGDIPQHWDVRRLKHLARFQSGDGITALQIETAGPFPVYGGNGRRGYATRYTHDGHYALIGRQGALCGNINFAQGKFFASEHAVVPTLIPGVCVLWFGELVRAMNLNQYSQSAAQPGLAVERIKNLYVPVPPSGEQHAIASAFELSTEPLARAITRIEREIDLLREYRTRLVADVVTGKLDVREAAARLPDEASPDIAQDASDSSDKTETTDEDAAA
jgi:type I restriction enzyme, S subunit